MIFDSQEQKEFFFKVLRSYVCSYGESLVISERYAPGIQNGEVISFDEQKAFLEALKPGPRPEETEMTPPQPKKLKDPAN